MAQFVNNANEVRSSRKDHAKTDPTAMLTANAKPAGWAKAIRRFTAGIPNASRRKFPRLRRNRTLCAHG